MCDSCEWETLLETIEDMLSDDGYEFAADFLESVQEWVQEHEHCTDKQVEGVENVRLARA